MKEFQSLGNRVIALVLSIILVLGMLPSSVLALNPSTLTTDIGEKTFMVGQVEEFAFTTTANDDAGTFVLGTFEFSDSSAVQKLEYLEVQSGNWYEFYGDFGPAGTGFPLTDATSRFRVTFKKAGTYSVTASMVTANDRTVLCSTTQTVTVGKKAGTLTTDIGEKTFMVGQVEEFAFTTTANDDAGTFVLGTFEFSDSSAVQKLEYLEVQSGNWYEFYGDFGPAGTGFPLTDATSRFRVTFKKAGNYTLVASVKAVANGAVVSTCESEVLVAAANQTGFGFAADADSVTYNDIDKNAVEGKVNEYTLITVGGQAVPGVVTYEIIDGDAAVLNEGGVLTILKAGAVKIKATKAGDDWYGPAESIFELTIEKAEQSFTFTHDKQISEKYGLTSFLTEFTASELNSGVVSYEISGDDIGASVNGNGLVSFGESIQRIGTITVTVTMVEDDCYKPFTDSYTITLTDDIIPGIAYILQGDKIISDGPWFTGDVTIVAPEGYKISYRNRLYGSHWKDSVVWTTDGEDGKWDSGSAPVVYLKNKTTGAITNAIYVKELKKDAVKPNGLSISYDVSVLATIGEKLFGFSATTVKVTVTAEDSTSGIAKMEYSMDDGTNYIELHADNGAYEFEVPSQYRGQLWIRATDVAGNAEVYKHVDKRTQKILVVDHTEPGLIVGYVGGMDDEATSGVRYVKGEKVTVVFRFRDENFDLRGADPIVTVNGKQQTGWVFDAVSGMLTFDLSAEGDYVIRAEFTDRLDRKVTYDADVVVDRTKPEIESTIEDGEYYTEEQIFELTITDHNFNAAEVNLSVYAENSRCESTLLEEEIQAFRDYAKDPANWTNIDGTDKYQLKLELTKEGNYTVKVDCADDLGWESDLYMRTFTIDKNNPYYPALSYEVGPAKGNLIVEMLNKLFGFAKETTVVSVHCGDEISGVARVEYKLQDSDEFIQVPVDTQGWYRFNLDPQYRGTITVVVYDMAGHSIEMVEEKEIVVDDIAPKVEISFTGDRQAAVKADDEFGISRETMTEFDTSTRFIYNSEVTATIKVKEANFFPDYGDMTVEITCDGIVVDDLAAAGISDSGWSFAEDAYTRTFVMTKDGDYQLCSEYRDHSLNDMEWESGECAQTGTHRYLSNIHTVDTTAPVYEVIYDNNDLVQTVDGREYYAATREATIRITDRNFRPDEVVFNVSYTNMIGGNVEYSKLTSWSDWIRDGDTWTAIVPFAADANYTVSYSYVDLAGYKMVSTGNVEEVYDKQFTVDTTKPIAVDVSYKSKDEHVLNKILNAITFGNYQAAQEVVLTMTDATAGIDYIELFVTPDGPASATNLEMPVDLVVNADGTVKSGTQGFIGTIKRVIDGDKVVMSFDVPAQFRGKVSFVAYDKSWNASNSHADSGVLVVDTIAPGYTISYNPSNVVKVSDMKDMAGFDAANGITDMSGNEAYVMYFSGDAVATIEIEEANFDASQVVLAVLDANGKAVQNWTQTGWVTTTKDGEADRHTKTVTIAAEGDYQIKVFYRDHSMNAPADYLSQWIVVDKTAPVINVKYSNTDVKNTIGNRDYFASAQTATITIKEHNFRADDVMILVTAKNAVGADVLALNNDGTVKTYANQGADRKSWTAYTAGTWRAQNDTYVITLNFTTDANYSFDIVYQDLAGNKAADYEKDLFTVDATAPKNLKVSYSTSVFEQIKESITFGYYNAMMTVTITAEDDTSGIYHFAYSYIKGKGVSSVNAQLLNQAIKEADITYDGKKATATFGIPKMVLGSDNQFNGTVEFTGYDCSENNTKLKDKRVIVVDNISPTSKITYNAPVQEVNGVSYYAGDINVAIAINEANFDAKDVVVSVKKDGNSFPVEVSWQNASVDSHTGTFTLTEDGDYAFTVKYNDKSGNKMATYTSNKLTLDTTAPTVTVSNIQANSANKDEKYSFVITLEDANLDAEAFQPILVAVLRGEDGKFTTVKIDPREEDSFYTDTTYIYKIHNLPDDGLYTLICTAKDMSGNTVSEMTLDDGNNYNQVQFSINRNGSVFGYGNEFSKDLVDQYYVHTVNQDIVIEEINVDPVNDYKITLNGKELVDGTDYVSIQSSGDGQWSKRTYTIKKTLFNAEGNYSIIVSSTDKTNTTAFSDVKNLSLSFVVDRTKPVITLTGLEAGGRYQTDEQTVTLIPSDEGGRLNSLTVLALDVNGNPLKDNNDADISVRFKMSGVDLLKYLEENDGKVNFTIPNGLNNQIRILCNDCAVNKDNLTNEYNEVFERVTVSQNGFVIFYANTPLFIGSIVGVLALIGLIIFLIKRKGDQKNTAANA